MLQVSIILVNYNTKDLLANCLKSIYEQSFGIQFEIIVVDNASTDGSEEHIKILFPNVIWINSCTNLGFGRANNLGASKATGEYLFMLNSDTILKNNAIAMFLEYMQKYENQHLGIIGGYLRDSHGNINFSYGTFPSAAQEFRYIVNKIFGDKVSVATRSVDFVSGADMFMKRELFNLIGGFDPNIFMYYEETDLQYRLHDAGYVQKIIEGPDIIHFEGGSEIKNFTYNRFIMSQKSYNYYIKKHFYNLNYLFMRVTLILLRLSLFITTDWSFKEKVSAYKLTLLGK